jgi:uncharacterized protein YcbX
MVEEEGSAAPRAVSHTGTVRDHATRAGFAAVEVLPVEVLPVEHDQFRLDELRGRAVSVAAMEVSQLWRHPVKSLQGEQVVEAVVEDDGLQGDRAWGIRDEATGRILTGRREPALLLAASTLTDDGRPRIVLPSGEVCVGPGPASDAALSAWLGRAVRLVAAVDLPPSTAEFFADPTDDSSPAIEWTMPPARFVDTLPVLLVTTATLRAGAALHPGGAWEPRRFRPNVLVQADGADEFVEDGWCGRVVRVGEVEFEAREPCVRCTMVTRPQPGLDRDLDVYKVLARHHGGTLGVWATVRTPGTIRARDPVEVLPER